MAELTPDVLIIGAGPAGLAAGCGARDAGAESVVVLDRNEWLGGILPQCIHTGFGQRIFREDLAGPEYADRYARKAIERGVEFRTGTLALEVEPSRRVVAVNPTDGLMVIDPKAVVLAMGCRERTRGALLIPGTRPAGVYTAGTVQRLVNLDGYLPGKRAVVLGSGDIGNIMARRLTLEGCKVEAVVEILPYPAGIPRNVVQCLEDFEIPLLLRHTVTEVHGADRVEAVTIAEVDAMRRPIAGTEREIACDMLLLSAGLIPENELSRRAGIEIDPLTAGPRVDDRMMTSAAGIFACGNVAVVYDVVDHASIAGETAGRAAAAFARGEEFAARPEIRLRAGKNVRLLCPQILRTGEPATLCLRVTEPLREAEIRVGEIKTFKRPFVQPGEMVVLALPGISGEEALTVEVTGRRVSA